MRYRLNADVQGHRRGAVVHGVQLEGIESLRRLGVATPIEKKIKTPAGKPARKAKTKTEG